MKNNMVLGFIFGVLAMGVVMLAIFYPIIERNRDFGFEMADIYIEFL